jgi:cytochrome P450
MYHKSLYIENNLIWPLQGKETSMKLPPFISDLSLPPVEYHQQLRQWSREMRDTSPVIWDDNSASWLVFRYEDVARVQSDYQTFSSEGTIGDRGNKQESRSIIAMDPPRHRQLRSLITQAFSAKTIAAMAPQIERIVDELFEGILTRKDCDWMADLANPLPVIVIANMLGLPIEEWPNFKEWTDAIVNESPGAEQASGHFSKYFAEAIKQRQQRQGSDILSLLIASEVDGERLTYEDLMSFCFTLFIAGNITTTNVLGNSMLCFNDHPEELARLRQRPELVASAVEEVIRYMSPFRAGPNGLVLGRVAKTDVELSGQPVRKGEYVQVNRLSANFDERQFPDPERFDIGRAPNRHQSFGQGVHFCLGAPLARLEVRIVLEKVAQKFQTLRIVPGAQLKQAQSMLIFGVQSVPVEFQAA